MAHALLGPSGSSRWLACPPSARLEEKEKDTASVPAREGTLAHEICEQMLRFRTEEISKRAYNTRINKLKKHELFANDMIEYCEVYADYVMERYYAAKRLTPDAELKIEQRVDYSSYVPDGFGTGDAIIIGDGTLRVIDFKYGKGVGVSAKDNTQMKLYALGAYLEYELMFDIKNIQMSIVQPRKDNISESGVFVDKLLKWSEEYAKPRGELAYKGEGDFCAGEHCKFCKIKPKCKAYADKQMELAKYDFKQGPFLDESDIADIVLKAGEFKKWIKSVEEYALDQAVNHGTSYPGMKLVEGRSNRKYTDDEKVVQVLTDNNYEKDTLYKPIEVLGITAMEKLIGKKTFNTLLSDYVIKPQGKPALVSADDKRPPWHSEDDAKNDFMDVM